jgi:hypothetical protein
MSQTPNPSSPSSAAPSDPTPEKKDQESGISGHSRAISGIPAPDVETENQLSNEQIHAIQLALEGHSWGEIAEAVGIDPKTLWRWRNQNVYFQEALANSRALRLQTSDDRAQSFADQAADLLSRVMEESEEKYRIRAAQILLNYSVRIRPKSNTKEDDSWPEPELPYKMG